MDDFFSEKTVENLKNISQFSVKEVWTIYSGRCFTISKLEGVHVLDTNFDFDLKKAWDVVAYVHRPGDEFWLSTGL